MLSTLAANEVNDQNKINYENFFTLFNSFSNVSCFCNVVLHKTSFPNQANKIINYFPIFKEYGICKGMQIQGQHENIAFTDTNQYNEINLTLTKLKQKLLSENPLKIYSLRFLKIYEETHKKMEEFQIKTGNSNNTDNSWIISVCA